ncbi:MAG: hypothetical protein D6784_17235 [Chloroflexi bacterium]|nr:MAG: hypothetical protein D6784_17235 [Chloroflexota bacterium]
MEPGDTLEGKGLLLKHGRIVAEVDYHLTIPRRTHFFINPTGKLHFDYEDYLGGFILLDPPAADRLELAEYTLELASKARKTIVVERRYKKISHRGKPKVSFWVKIAAQNR